MSNFGKTIFDPAVTNQVIIRTNAYKQKVLENAAEVQSVCRNIKEGEQLSGGNGDIIRDSLSSIETACIQLTATCQTIVKSLNAKLGTYIENNKADKVASATEQMASAVAKVGKKE